MNTYTLVQYGGYNLTSNKCTVKAAPGLRDLVAPLQRLRNARATGSTPINRTIDERLITLSGSLRGGAVTYSNVLKEFKKALYVPNRYLHVVSTWASIVEPLDDSNWLFMGDAISKDFNTTEYQFGIGSVAFTADTNTNGYARLRNYDLEGVDLGEYQESGNFEFWLYIPDESIVTNISLSIGSDDSNFVWSGIGPEDANYDGKPLQRGWNYISIAWDNMTQVGTPDPYSMGKFVDIVVEYSSLPDSTTFLFGGLIWEDDDSTRNFPGYFEITKPAAEHSDITHSSFTAQFVNYTGLAVGSDDLVAYADSGVNTDNYQFSVDFDGTYDPEPVFYIVPNSVTNLESIIIENTTTEESVTITNTFVAGEYVIINFETKEVTLDGTVVDYSNVLPDFVLGQNNIEITLVSSSATSVSQTTINSDLGGEI